MVTPEQLAAASADAKPRLLGGLGAHLLAAGVGAEPLDQGPRALKTLSAPLAGEDVARLADTCLKGFRRERLAAPLAIPEEERRPQPFLLLNPAMLPPELGLSPHVAAIAEGDQVQEVVRLAVVPPQAERHDVVDRQGAPRLPAILAAVPVACPCRLALRLPVRPTVRGLVSPPPGSRCGLVAASPAIEAGATAEVTGLHRARLECNRRPAPVTKQADRSPLRRSRLGLLPSAVALSAAEVGLAGHVGLDAKRGAADFAGEFYHTD